MFNQNKKLKSRLIEYDQDGDRTYMTKKATFAALLLIVIVLIATIIFLRTPYSPSSNLDYKYKRNYYNQPDFAGYDFATQGRKKYNWAVDEKGLGDICHFWNGCMGWIHQNNKLVTKTAVTALQDWIFAVLGELEKSPIVDENFQGFPWGNNWYEFTIELPTTMAYYIVNNKRNGVYSTYAAHCIQYLIKNPQLSLGYERDKANSAMMLFPWTLAHRVTGTLNENDPTYIYAIQQYDLTPNVNIRANEDGIHLDYSYLTHGGVYAYGYLWSIMNIYPDTKQVIAEVANFNLDYHIDKIYSKIKHKTIDRAGCALWHRYRKLDGNGFYTGRTTTKPCEVIPSMRYIRMFGDTYHWSARTMQTTVAYYEADKTVDDMGLYAAVCRKVFNKDDSPEPVFPCPGFIYDKGVTELVRTPSTNTTTTPFFCQLSAASKSFVFSDGEKYGILFQYKMKLPPLISGEFTEVLCVYIEEERIESHYRLEFPGATLCCGDKIWVNEGEVLDKDGYIIMETNLRTRTYNSYLGPNDTSAGSYMPGVKDFTNNEYRERKIENAGTSAFIIDKNVNGVWKPHTYCPAEEQILTNEIPIDGVTFYYSPISNQFRSKDFQNT